MSEATHEHLRKAAIAWLKRNTWENNGGGGCNVVLSELVSAAADIPDAIGWTWGHSVAVECKVSRADYLADAKKPHRIADIDAGERRYFLTPPALLKPDELPEGWGLLELQSHSVVTVKKAEKREMSVAAHASEKRMLLSAIRRIRMREFLIISPEITEEVLSN